MKRGKYLRTTEILKKQSDAQKGKIGNNKGKKFSLETRKRMSDSRKDLLSQHPEISKEVSERMKKNLGSLNSNWRGGTASTTRLKRKSRVYLAWRKLVLKRDNFTCKRCGGNKDCRLNVDHIKPYFLYPLLMLDLNNGCTLCESCHRKTITYGSRLAALAKKDIVKVYDLVQIHHLTFQTFGVTL